MLRGCGYTAGQRIEIATSTPLPIEIDPAVLAQGTAAGGGGEDGEAEAADSGGKQPPPRRRITGVLVIRPDAPMQVTSGGVSAPKEKERERGIG